MGIEININNILINQNINKNIKKESFEININEYEKFINSNRLKRNKKYNDNLEINNNIIENEVIEKPIIITPDKKKIKRKKKKIKNKQKNISNKIISVYNDKIKNLGDINHSLSQQMSEMSNDYNTLDSKLSLIQTNINKNLNFKNTLNEINDKLSNNINYQLEKRILFLEDRINENNEKLSNEIHNQNYNIESKIILLENKILQNDKIENTLTKN